jgi:hypothetical protein
LLIAVGAALRAQPGAIGAAQRSRRRVEQHEFTHDWSQVELFTNDLERVGCRDHPLIQLVHFALGDTRRRNKAPPTHPDPRRAQDPVDNDAIVQRVEAQANVDLGVVCEARWVDNLEIGERH